MNRAAAYAGSWYPGHETALRAEIRALWPGDASPRPALATVTPHAGYRYSGATAARAFASVLVPRRVLLLGFSHRAAERGLFLWPSDAPWETPLGTVAISGALTEALLDACPRLQMSRRAQEHEHCLELQLPFLQHAAPSALEIAVVSVDTLDADALSDLGAALAQVLRQSEETVLIAATSDLSHEDGRPDLAEYVRRRDQQVLAALEALDAEEILRLRLEEGVTFCGSAPLAALCHALRAFGGVRAECLDYTTSDAVLPGAERIVGYAALRFVV